MIKESKKKPKVNGRPKKEFDLELVENLASIGATYEDMAGVFDCSVSTIEDRMRKDPCKKGGDSSRAHKKGQARLKVSLRREQIKLANQGNPTMLIWLGKQMLGQKDKSHNESEIQLKDITPTINLIAKQPDSEQP